MLFATSPCCPCMTLSENFLRHQATCMLHGGQESVGTTAKLRKTEKNLWLTPGKFTVHLTKMHQSFQKPAPIYFSGDIFVAISIIVAN